MLKVSLGPVAVDNGFTISEVIFSPPPPLVSLANATDQCIFVNCMNQERSFGYSDPE